MTVRNRDADAADAGFTLIELIVVLGIMSVLMALAVPSYMGLQQFVQNAATRSDLANDRIALVSWGIDNNGAVPAAGFDPSPAGMNLVGYGWSTPSSPGTSGYSTNVVGGTATAWCLQLTSESGTVYRVSQNKPIAEGTCLALGRAAY